MSREPVMTMAVVQAALALLVGFGVPISTEQMALLLAFIGALLSWIARTKVTPV